MSVLLGFGVPSPSGEGFSMIHSELGQKYRKSSHGLYDLKVHIVWITKYRYPVLHGAIALRLRDLVRRICTENDVIIVSASYPPSMSTI